MNKQCKLSNIWGRIFLTHKRKKDKRPMFKPFLTLVFLVVFHLTQPVHANESQSLLDDLSSPR
ncbi:MAG: hypothetical protein EB086_13425 [Rhodobacteraceae bacterium]|nr:hypothetical protein [Paracoccaceae bacterium]